MSGEAAAAEVVTQQSQEEQDADAALAAGFDKPEAQAPGETKPAAEAAPGTGEQEDKGTEAKPAAAAAPAAAPAPVLINGVPEAEWNAAVAKAAGPLVEAARAEIRKNFGQIGDLKRTIDELKVSLTNPAAGASTASRKKLTGEMLKRVDAELPGLGAAIAQDLAEFLDSPAVAADAAAAQAAAEAKGQVFDPEAFFSTKIGPALEKMEARVSAEAERAEMRIVKSLHRDFDTVIVSPEFGTWLGTLSVEEQKRIRDSEDGFVAADAVTDFKAYRDKQAKSKEKNQSRLERAVPASGDRQPREHLDQDEETQMATGFNQVRKK